jgi:hypothetical protein
MMHSHANVCCSPVGNKLASKESVPKQASYTFPAFNVCPVENTANEYVNATLVQPYCV